MLKIHIKKATKIFIFICLFLVCKEVSSQEIYDNQKYNSFLFGVGVNQIKEENIHPKVSTGAIVNLGYSGFSQQQNASFVEASFACSVPKTKFENSFSYNVKLHFAYSYLFKLGVANKKTNQLLGLKSNIEYDAGYYPNWDDSHLYWANDLTLGLRYFISYHITSKKTLILDLNVGLFSILSRPITDRQYKMSDMSFKGIMQDFHSNLTFGTVNKAFNINCLAEYKFISTPKLPLSLFYNYKYKMINNDIADKYQSNCHTVGLKFYFL